MGATRSWWRLCAMSAALVAAVGCGAASGPRNSSLAAYRYGDMFAGGGGGSGGYGAETTALASEPAPAYQADREAASVNFAADEEMAAEPSEPGSYPVADMGPPPARAAVRGEALAGMMGNDEGGAAGGVVAPVPAAPAEPTRAQYAEARTPAPRTGESGATQPAPGQQGQAATQTQQVQDAGTTGPLLIYEAEMYMAVHEVRERMDQVIAVTDEMGGFLQSQDDQQIIVRVPAARFRESLERISTLGDVLHRRISAQDVTDQVRDLRIRLRNAMEMRDRMAELLERATTVQDSLVIERELERLTETIELLRGQLENIQDRVSFSTITIHFQPVQVDQQLPRERFRLPFPWLDELGLANLLELRP